MGLFRSTATPKVEAGYELATPFREGSSTLERVTIADLVGISHDNMPATRGDAMSLPVIAKARTLICGAVARSPLVAMRNREPLEGGSLLLRQPENDPQRPRFVTLTWTVDDLMFHGLAWWVVNKRTFDGRPSSVEWVPFRRARVDETGHLIGTIDGRTFRREDVIRIDGPHEGILNFGRRTINQALRLDRAALRVSSNPMPAVDLHDTSNDPLAEEEIDKLTSRWRAARDSENGSVGYTSKRIEAKPMPGLSVEHLIIEGRKYASLELTRMMNVPAWVSDVSVEGSSLTYSNVASRSRELVDFGLRPYMAAIEERLSLDDVLPHGQWCRFDTEDLLRPDFKDRMDGYKAAQDAQIYTADELREMELGIPKEETESA